MIFERLRTFGTCSINDDIDATEAFDGCGDDFLSF